MFEDITKDFMSDYSRVVKLIDKYVKKYNYNINYANSGCTILSYVIENGVHINHFESIIEYLMDSVLIGIKCVLSVH